MLGCLRSPRTGVIITGYTCAAAAAGTAISLTLALIATRFDNLSTLGATLLFGLLLSAFTIPFTVMLAALPAAGVTVLAERYRIRSSWFYAAMGVLSAVVVIAAIALVGQLVQGTSKVPSAAPRHFVAILRELAGVLLVLGPAGLVGGLTYWATAGRDAGCTDFVARLARWTQVCRPPRPIQTVLAKTDMGTCDRFSRARQIHTWQIGGDMRA